MILKKQLHLDIETIYIMFFEGFLGVKNRVDIYSNSTFPSSNYIRFAVGVSRIHFILTTRYSSYIVAVTFGLSTMGNSWKQKIYGDDIVFSAVNTESGKWDVYFTLPNSNTDVCVLPLWVAGGNFIYSSPTSLPEGAITI